MEVFIIVSLDIILKDECFFYRSEELFTLFKILNISGSGTHYYDVQQKIY